MSKDIKDLTSDMSEEDSKVLLDSLKKLKNLLLLKLIQDDINSLDSESNDDKEDISVPVDNEEDSKEDSQDTDIMKEIKDIAEYNTNGDETLFLLHRTVNSNDYNEEEGNIFDSSSESEWYVTVKGAEKDWSGDTPLVSCWVPEKDVIQNKSDVPKNNGTWGALGENPAKDDIKIAVKSGKYTIEKVIKQRVS